VSVATLVRVLFEHPQTGELMLVLERKATVFGEAGQPRAHVRAQPFGGAIQFRNLEPLQTLIGSIQFDSDRSRLENDFRILIRPADWVPVREFCLQHLVKEDDAILDSSPARELAEEFADALGINLKPDDYRQFPSSIVIEDRPTPTDNPRASGHSTVRIYRNYEARLIENSHSELILANSDGCSDDDLREQALADFRNGGRGRANAVLALPLNQLTHFYLALPLKARAEPVSFYGYQLDRNVPAVLEGVPVPGYQVL
jgi:hypothetical protein